MKKLRFVFSFLCLLLWSVTGWGQSANQEKDIKDFVSKTYIHGLPYKQARSFGKETLPVLENLLYDPAYAKYKANVVLCIGILGKAEGFKTLQTYFYKQQSELDYSTFMSILISLPALGHVAQNGNKEAMNLLIKLANPDNWQRTGLHFSYRNYKGETMGMLISKLAVQGLGVSGRAEALNLLNQMSNPADKKYKAKLQNDIKDAIQLNKQIQAEGAEKVFEKEEEK